MPASSRAVAVIIPAHNEEAVLPRTLSCLSAGAARFDVIVVCNGCTDATAEVARSFPWVHVIELDAASKHAAMTAGVAAATASWVVLLDADVVIGARDLDRLVEPLRDRTALATGPRREIDRTGTSWVVAAYYDVWERLPSVRAGLFGRGVIALAPEGISAFRALPPAISDDLVISESVPAADRTVVDGATVRIVPPQRLADLLRRRTRVVTGNAQADREHLRTSGSRTTARDLLDIARSSPLMVPKVAAFAGVTVLARLRARRAIRAGDVTTWLRDESSRAGTGGNESSSGRSGPDD